MKPVISWASCAAAVLLAAIAPAVADEGLRWETDLPSAQRLARETNRLVLIHFGGPWCPPCQMLEQKVFSQPGFGRQLTADYVAVKVDPNASERNHEIAKQYQVERVPADVIATPAGQLIYRISSPSTAEGYVAAMTRAAAQARPERQGAPAPVQVAARPVDDRYADHYNRRQNVEREPYQPPVQNQVAQNQLAQNPAQQQPAADRYAERSPAPSSSSQQGQYPQQTTVQTAGTQPSAEPPAGAEQPIELRIPPGSPPLALEGYCPVTLVESRSLPSGAPWQVGDPNVGAIHRGMLYLFTNAANQQKFLANPDRYSPVLRGHDPVLALDKNQAVPGRREFGVFCEGRIYLFSSEATLEHFARNSKRYSADILQAMR
ncbi:MAG TPA: thioredoxin family protein [Pirellulales bacterium]|jgi:YHS domain-containing protein/thiol-disulfide isomerase/thioredoxin|nr:thioredoxin family protein [Pirellulales bacterium]